MRSGSYINHKNSVYYGGGFFIIIYFPLRVVFVLLIFFFHSNARLSVGHRHTIVFTYTIGIISVFVILQCRVYRTKPNRIILLFISMRVPGILLLLGLRAYINFIFRTVAPKRTVKIEIYSITLFVWKSNILLLYTTNAYTD